MGKRTRIKRHKSTKKNNQYKEKFRNKQSFKYKQRNRRLTYKKNKYLKSELGGGWPFSSGTALDEAKQRFMEQETKKFMDKEEESRARGDRSDEKTFAESVMEYEAGEETNNEREAMREERFEAQQNIRDGIEQSLRDTDEQHLQRLKMSQYERGKLVSNTMTTIKNQIHKEIRETEEEDRAKAAEKAAAKKAKEDAMRAAEKANEVARAEAAAAKAAAETAAALEVPSPPPSPPGPCGAPRSLHGVRRPVTEAERLRCEERLERTRRARKKQEEDAATIKLRKAQYDAAIEKYEREENVLNSGDYNAWHQRRLDERERLSKEGPSPENLAEEEQTQSSETRDNPPIKLERKGFGRFFRNPFANFRFRNPFAGMFSRRKGGGHCRHKSHRKRKTRKFAKSRKH